MKKSIFCILLMSVLPSVFFAKETTLASTSDIDWTTKIFKSEITLDIEKAQLKMPSGKKTAAARIKTKTPELVQRPLLTLFVDNNECLGDEVIKNAISVDSISNIISNGKSTPELFSNDLKKLTTTNTLDIDDISSILVKHKYGYTPEVPIETVPSRVFSGIIIDARGAYPVHGEYIESEIYPCFFPRIWDDEMNTIYEKNISSPSITLNDGIVKYDYSDDYRRYEERVGADPLYIRATEVYGRNRTDPVIKKSDALKILTVPENVKLLNEGKVVILLDKKNLIYKVESPQKDEDYYVKYNTVKQYLYENKVDDISISDGPKGIEFLVDLKFYPDSPELLPAERTRIQKIYEMLSEIMTDNSYTVLVEGHTADVGKPVGQMNLSIERTRTVMKALVSEGLDEKLFTYKGYGGTMPVATNETEEGRAQNRRVIITARPRATYIQRDW